MGKLFRATLLALNVVVIIAMIMVKVGSQVNPNTCVFPAYFSLMLFPVILLNVFFIVFWLLFRKWYFILSFITLILFSAILRSTITFPFGKNAIDTTARKVTILSYNTMNTGLLKKYLPNNNNGVISHILNSNADILCLQEFAYSYNEDQFTLSDMEKLFKDYPYKHISFQRSKWNMKIGVATFSKFPIINKRDIDYEADFNRSIFSDIVIGNDTVRVINNHLESNRITSKDIRNTAKLRSDFSSEKFSELTKYLSRKMSVAYKVRAKQALAVAKSRDESPYKVIVCGDFNDVPSSYTYAKMKGDLKDAFKEVGSGLGWTFEKSLYRLRIDYILYDSSFDATSFKTTVLQASDHYPIQVDFKFN